MGHWNYRIFCDDAAWDALERLRQSEDVLEDLQSMLQYVDLQSYASCQEVIAAAATVDAIKRGIRNDFLVENPDGLDEFTMLIVVNEDLNVDALELTAMQALDNVAHNSVLAKHWEQEPDFSLWWDNLAKLRSRF